MTYSKTQLHCQPIPRLSSQQSTGEGLPSTSGVWPAMTTMSGPFQMACVSWAWLPRTLSSQTGAAVGQQAPFLAALLQAQHLLQTPLRRQQPSGSEWETKVGCLMHLK
jgi:hypothetical protein